MLGKPHKLFPVPAGNILLTTQICNDPEGGFHSAITACEKYFLIYFLQPALGIMRYALGVFLPYCFGIPGEFFGSSSGVLRETALISAGVPEELPKNLRTKGDLIWKHYGSISRDSPFNNKNFNTLAFLRS